MILPVFLAVAGAAQTPVGDENLRCAGGAMIFFQRGSAQIDTASANRLSALVNQSRSLGIVGLERIELGGDGSGNRFDAALSRRRSEAIRALLARLGDRSQETIIAVAEELGQADPGADDYQFVGGWVAVRLPSQEYERIFPRELIGECT